MIEPYYRYKDAVVLLDPKNNKLVKSYNWDIPDNEKHSIFEEAKRTGLVVEPGLNYLSLKYDNKNWEYGKYITEPLDNFPVKGIVVKLSGGADSSIVYYRLCKELSERNLDIPLYVVTLDPETKDWYSHYAKKVIAFTKEKTGIEPKEHRIRKLSKPWNVEDYQIEQDIVFASVLEDGLANVYYGGLTENPDPVIMTDEGYNIEGMTFESYDDCLTQARDRDSDRDNNNGKWSIGYGIANNGPLADLPHLGILPFVHKDKRHGTAAMYIETGVLDELLPLTYSCEEHSPQEKQKLEIVDGYQEYSHCGKCWFCLERAYAFGRLV